MGERLREFVADDLWLLIGVVTFALTSLAGVADLVALSGAIAIVGWFLLTPIFLFWGEEVASLLDERGSSVTRSRESDAYDELKRRYAAGEIDDDEFERRLDRLVTADDAFDRTGSGDEFASARDAMGSATVPDATDDPSDTADEADDRDRTREFER